MIDLRTPFRTCRRTGLIAAFLLFGFAAYGPAKAAGTSSDVKPSSSPIGNYLAGRHAQAQRDLSAAVTYLDAALKALPGVPDLLRRTFILMVIEGRIGESLPLAEKLVKTDPKAAIANLVLAVEALKTGDRKVLRSRLENQPENGINGFTRPALEAWGLARDSKTDEALKALKPLDGSNGSQGLHDLHAALLLDFSGRTDAAIAAYKKIAGGKNGPSFRLIQHLGRLYERSGKSKEALALYTDYLEKTPGTTLLDRALDRVKGKETVKGLVTDANAGAAEALFNIANSLRQQRAKETALVLGRLALYLKPRFPIAQMMIADILEDDDRRAKANAIYEDIGAGSAFRLSADLRRAHNMNVLNELEPAIVLLRELSAKRPHDPRPMTSLGNMLRRHDRWDEAITAYTDAISRVGTIQKHHWRMLYSRGIVLERAKRWPEAERDFLKALEFEPDQPYVLNYLGYSWVDQGLNLDKALDMIRRAVKLRPTDGYIIDSLGWVYYRLGKYEKAALELERAIQIRPEDPIINDHLGDAYWRVGRRLEARFQWEHSLSLKPKDEVAKEVRKKLKEGMPPAKVLVPATKAPKASAPDKT